MFGYKKIIFLMGLFAATSAAGSAPQSGPVRFSLKRAHCKVFEQKGSSVTRSPYEFYQPSRTYLGRPHTKNPNYFVTQIGQRIFLVETNCVQPVPSSASPLVTQVTPLQASPHAKIESPELPTAPAKPALSKNWGLKLNTSFVSYQTKITVTDLAAGSADILTQTNALYLGGIFSRSLSSLFDLRLSSGILMGSVNARGSIETETESKLYQNDRVSVFGIKSSIGVSHRLESPGVTIGVSIPVILQAASFDNAEGAVEVSSPKLLFGGLLFQLEAERGKWLATTEFGFIQKFSQSLWSFGFGYLL